ncbi:MAG: HAMP domain-containing sensor histidine kinase [Alphaproteobacteria bacterium]
MFSYLRYFAVISLILVVLGSVALSMYFRDQKRAEIVASSLTQAQATVGSYTDTVWRDYEVTSRTNSTLALSQLSDASAHFFAHQDIAKVTVFSADVTKLFYGSSTAYVTTDGSTRVTLFDFGLSLRAQPVTRLLTHVFLTGGPNPNKPRVMLQTVLPIMAEGFTDADRDECSRYAAPKCVPEALVETYLDVSDQWAKLIYQQYLTVGVMTGMFVLLVIVMLITSWRAESIIEKQHEINLELTAAAAQAEAQNRDKSQFLASISHELRTPLNAIIGFSEIIKNEAKHQLDKAYQDYVDDIYSSGRHLLSLINDILDFSKAEAGKLQIEWAETDATKVIRNSLRMVLPRAETAQVTLVEDIPTTHLVIVTDPKKFKQVLLNLLSNAVKFTPAGGEVRCQAWEDVVSQRLVIQVKDTGIGIAPKDISRVMMPFGQVDSTLSRKYEGTGLGLPLSKKFVEIMGGQFAIESELNVGTTITVTLPKTPGTWQADRAAGHHGPTPVAEIPEEPVPDVASKIQQA